jgi:Bax protein
VPPVVFHHFPSNITDLDNDIKKKAFLHALLPAALIALNEVESERAALQNILNKISNCPPELKFDRKNRSWHASLTSPEKMYLQFLIEKYRTEEVAKLLLRVNTVPVSLMLAQGAVESSWGASRFVLEGNNIFGIWTWGKQGIIPQKREQGKNHKVAAYESLLDSVRAYLLTLNRVPAYTKLRTIRAYSMDPYDLAQGLIYYSERRVDYVEEITSIIKTNDLIRYDRFNLSMDD